MGRYEWGGTDADRFDFTVPDPFERGWTDNRGQRWHKPPYRPAKPCGPAFTAERPARRRRIRALVWAGLIAWSVLVCGLVVWIGGWA